MDETLTLTELVERRYGMQGVALYPLDSESGKRIYRVEQANGQRWVLRAYAPGDAGDRPSDLVNMLSFLEAQGYPAERLVAAVDGTVVSRCDDWKLLVTTFIAGSPADYSLESLYAMGELLGRLNALKPEDAAGMGLSIPPAEMLIEPELAFALVQLTSVAGQVPENLRERYETLVAAVQDLDRCEHLPMVVIHNDYHPGNVVCTATGELIPID